MGALFKTVLAGICFAALGSNAAETSTDCQETTVPDLSRFRFSLETSTKYDSPELGIGSTYQTGDFGQPGFIKLSLYIFDLGLKEITGQDEQAALAAAHKDIVASYKDYTFAQPYQMPGAVFEGMGGFLGAGFYMDAVNPNAPMPEIHMVGVGQYHDCFVKIRLTGYWDGGLDNKDDLILTLKLFRTLSRRLQQQVQGPEWTGPQN